jgi:hypothetical protein
MGTIGPYPVDTAIIFGKHLMKIKYFIGKGRCQEGARKLYGLDSDGSPTAWADRSPAFHYGAHWSKAPRGALLRWSGGSDGAGHVAIRGYGTKCLSAGTPDNPGYFGICDIDEFATKWGLKYRGWDPEISGKRVV